MAFRLDTFLMMSDDTGVDLIHDFNLAEGDQIDLTAYAEDTTVIGWSATDSTDDGVDNPLLQVLYEGGGSKDVAVLSGVTADDLDDPDFDNSVLLF